MTDDGDGLDPALLQKNKVSEVDSRDFALLQQFKGSLGRFL
jgi:hypothetical protein